MEPTLSRGDHFFVRIVRNDGSFPERGALIVFRGPVDPGREWIKRVIGLPFDEISFIDGDLHINGQRVEQRFLGADEEGRSLVEENLPSGHSHSVLLTGSGSANASYAVPSGHVFVLGDNRARSLDSRDPQVGMVPIGEIIGHPLFIYWSRDLRKLGSYIR